MLPTAADPIVTTLKALDRPAPNLDGLGKIAL